MKAIVSAIIVGLFLLFFWIIESGKRDDDDDFPHGIGGAA